MCFLEFHAKTSRKGAKISRKGAKTSRKGAKLIFSAFFAMFFASLRATYFLL